MAQRKLPMRTMRPRTEPWVARTGYHARGISHGAPIGTVDLDHLLKLRAIVGRFGEMAAARRWNTTGQLGPVGGAMAIKRGLPCTHGFAQSRSVFAVATHRCAEIFQPPKGVSFWLLPPDIEEAFDAKWEPSGKLA
jgi:hypothetical protein